MSMIFTGSRYFNIKIKSKQIITRKNCNAFFICVTYSLKNVYKKNAYPHILSWRAFTNNMISRPNSFPNSF